jgi:two-component system, NtrC family, sensor kinase
MARPEAGGKDCKRWHVICTDEKIYRLYRQWIESVDHLDEAMKELSSIGHNRRIVGAAVLVAVAVLILIGGPTYCHYSKTRETIIIDQIRTMAASQSQAVDVFLRERASLLAVLVETHPYGQLSRHGVLTGLFTAMNLRGDMLGLLDLGVIDANGYQTAYVGPFDLRGLNYEQQPWFHEVMAKGKYISDVYLGYRRQPHFIIAVRGITGEDSWVLRATIDSEVFDRLVLGSQTGPLGDAFIVNGAGIYQTTPRHLGNVLEPSDISPQSFGQGIITVEKKTVDGAAYYYAGAWLRNKNWLLIIRRPAG